MMEIPLSRPILPPLPEEGAPLPPPPPRQLRDLEGARPAGGRARVTGALVPCGLETAPGGEDRFEDLVDHYKDRVAALRRAGAEDFLLWDMASLTQARAALLAVKETAAGAEVLVSFTCNEEGFTATMTDVLAALIVMEGMGASAFGLCGMPPGLTLRLLERLAPYAAIPLLAVPAGKWEEGPIRQWVQECLELGVRCFGAEGSDEEAALFEALAEQEAAPFIPRQQDEDVIPCAGKEARFITPDIDVGEPIECSPDLLEKIVEAEEEFPQGALKIAILEQDDVDIFAENQYAVRDALCLWSDTPDLLEQALRVFQGRAFWDGTSELEEDFLRRMADKYGLVRL